MSIRLINTSSLRMEEFTGEGIPAYAILSHTWDNGKEVSYQEMTRIAHDPDHPAMRKPGYSKILNTCKKARSHGIEYAWVDTCCIDKTSSAELSEAINSMFKFYQNAEVCYAFLNDITPYMSIVSHLRNCRWFTRGWCLQELLAPEDLRFYDKMWEFMGSKSTLKDLISECTGIDERALDGTKNVHDFSICQRMSWASMRRTTRIEDMAYCLLGILDVNMPMLYGEGDKAFLRLQEEVMRRSNDMSIFAFEDIRPSHKGGPDFEEEFEASSPYRDLLATSPRNFARSGNYQNTNDEVMPTQSYMLTNRGLYLRAAKLLVGKEFEDYLLPLHCINGVGGCYYLYLRKVGPSQFVRLRHPRELKGRERGLFDYSETEEAYIITKITPSFRAALSDRSHMRSIQLNFHAPGELRDAIQDASPRDRWDAASFKFLSGGMDSFEGSLKIFPSLMGNAYSNIYVDYLYLVCGVEWSTKLKYSGRPDRFEISETRAWVSLFSAEEWETRDRRTGKFATLFTSNKHRSAELTIGRGVFRARVRSHKSVAYDVHIDVR